MDWICFEIALCNIKLAYLIIILLIFIRVKGALMDWKRYTVAVLVDMSPAVYLFFRVGAEIQRRGGRVIWICESRLPLMRYNFNFDGDTIFYSDYDGGAVDHKCSTGVMFSNYDRDMELKLLRDKCYYDSRAAGRMIGFFSSVFKKFGVQGVLYENVSNAFSYCAYLAAEQSNAKYFGLIGSRVPGRFELWANPYGLGTEIQNKLAGSIKASSYEVAKKYLDSRVAPDYMVNNPTSHSYSYISHYFAKLSAANTLRSFFSWATFLESRRAIQSHHPLVDVSKRLVRVSARRLRLYVLSKFYQEPVDGEHYYVYPLHYHPESSTSVLAPQYVDELSVIRNVAFSLPLGSMLYVKDHPNAAGFKKVGFYKELMSLPNVRLISYNVPVHDLLARSKGVITLTSTMGFEALLDGLSAYVFGRVFYSSHPNCICVRSYDELYQALAAGPRISVSADYNLSYVAAYVDVTYEGRATINPIDRDFEGFSLAVLSAISGLLKDEG